MTEPIQHAVVTGGAGFIGSHLTQRLLDAGARVTVIDDLSTGRRVNLDHLPGDRCTLLEGRAGAVLASTPGLLNQHTAVFHLAAAVGVKLVVDDPPAMIRNNIDETAAVLAAAAEANATLLLASSSEVYGRCPVLPLREDMELVYGPTTASRWSYGLTKALDEHLAIDYARRRGLRAVVVRLFNTIGPRQVGRYGMVVPRFVARAAAGQPLEVYGDGAQTRAFCDVRDVVRALADLITCDDAYGGVFNVGSDQRITIADLAQRVVERVAAAGGPRSEVKRVPYEAVYGEGFEDPQHRLPDLARIRAAIDWSPAIPLERTLDDLIALALPAASAPGVGGETP